MRQTAEDVLMETGLTEEWQQDGFNLHVFTTQQPLGRRRGGLSCFIKASLSPLEVLHKDENILIVILNQPHFVIDKTCLAVRKFDQQEALLLAGDSNFIIDKWEDNGGCQFPDRKRPHSR